MSGLSPLQRLVVQTRDRDLLVSAGAGSGKTLVLVERLLGCIRDEVPLDRILVVTFTEKAAAELRNKVYRKLGESPDLAPLRHHLPQARISTIHSFCARTLRENFGEAGLDPRFRVLPAEDAALLLTAAMDRVFRNAYRGTWGAERRECFEELVEICGHDSEGERLRTVVRRLLDYARTAENPTAFFKRHLAQLNRGFRSWDEIPWKEAYAEQIGRQWLAGIGLLGAIVEELTGAGADAAVLARPLQELSRIDAADLAKPDGQRNIIERLEAAGLLEDGERPRVKLPNLPRTKPKVEGLSDFKGDVQDLFRGEWLRGLPLDPDAILNDERQSSRLARELVNLTIEVSKAYEEAKNRRSCLDFSDLEIRTLELLTKAPALEERVRFDRIFIDEFQDVNGLQHRILEKLCDPRGIFRVGDIKQSIYQFRLADPSIFRDLTCRRTLVANPERPPLDQAEWTVPLPDNYRSRPPILEFVNHVAERLFLPREIGTAYETQRLNSGLADPGNPPPVEFMLVRQSGNEAEDSVRAEEAEGCAIAERIRSLIDDHATCLDPETREERPLTYSDIAILLRAHAPGVKLQRTLEEQGIPVYISSGASFFRAREIADVIQLLTVVDNLLDDIALAAVLRSPAFCWQDSEILALRLAYPDAVHLAYGLALLADEALGGARFASAILPEDPIDAAALAGARADHPGEPLLDALPAKCAVVMEKLLTWRSQEGVLELPELIVRILEETDLLRSVASLPGGLRRQSNLRKFGGLARRYATDSGHSLHQFLRWLKELQAGRAKIAEAPISSESTQAVRILSIHEAKGLEFPVVFVARLDYKPPLGEPVSALALGKDFLGVQILNTARYLRRQPVPLRLLRAESKSDGLAEEKRILYVALTRARDRLILSGIKSSRSAPSAVMQRAFRRVMGKGKEIDIATAERLLEWKRSYLGWLLYTLPALEEPAEDGPAGGDDVRPVAGLPLALRWIEPRTRVAEPPLINPIREAEPLLKKLEPIPIEVPPDLETIRCLEQIAKLPPLPSPGHLAHARGKIWATEFKSGRAFPAGAAYGGVAHEAAALGGTALRAATQEGSAGGAAADRVAESESAAQGSAASGAGIDTLLVEEGPDEAAIPLFPPDAEAAQAEGRLIHSILEQLDFAGLERRIVAERIISATQRIGTAPEWIINMLNGSLAAFIDSAIGRSLASSASIEREVSFSLRMGILEAAGLLPALRAEILSSPEWAAWIAEDQNGSLRVVNGKDPRAAEPWILVQGRIDLIFRDAGGWVVLDWKSDRVSTDAEIAGRVDNYRGQMEIYRRAAAHLFGEPIRAVLCFLRPGIMREA